MSDPRSDKPDAPMTPSPASGAPSPSPASAPSPPKPRRRWRSPGLVLGTLLTPALVCLAGLNGYALLATEPGTQWLLARVPGLELESAQGSLLGDFSARRLSVTLPGSGDRIAIESLQWQGLTLNWNRSAALWADVSVEALSADRVRVDLKPSETPTTAPQDLKIPLGLLVRQLRIAELRIPSLSELPVTGVQARLALGSEGGATHRLDIQQLQWDQLQLQGELQQASDAGLQTQARLRLRSLKDSSSLPAWTAQLTAQGRLPALQLQAQLQSREQSLKADAELHPFAEDVLRSLRAQTQGLDLSALWSSAPRTALTGDVQVKLQNRKLESPQARPGKDKPVTAAHALLQVQAKLRNTMAGRWDQGALPVRDLDVDLSLRPGDPASLRLRSLDLQLGSASSPAGRLRASGQSASKTGSALSISLEDLRSEHLDARLQSLQAQGQIRLKTDKTIDQLDQQDLPPLQMEAELQGRLMQGRWQQDRFVQGQINTPLQLQLRAQASQGGLKIEQLRLIADAAAQLDLQGQWQGKARDASGWTLEGSAHVQATDLRRLLPAPAHQDAKAWVLQPQALEGHVRWSLAKPATTPGRTPQAGTTSPVRTLAGWVHELPRGQIQAQFSSPALMGLPLLGEMEIQNPPAQPDKPLLNLRLLSGQQELNGQLRWTDAQRWVADLKLQLPQLQALQPVLGLLAPGSRLQGQVHGQARWQAEPSPGQSLAQWASLPWQAQGQLQAQQLQWQATAAAAPDQLGEAKLDWALDSSAQAQQRLLLSFRQLQLGNTQLARGQLQWQGRWADHELLAQADAKLPAPAALLSDVASAGQAQGSMELRVRGALSDTPLRAWSEGGQWQAKDLSLLASPALAHASASASARPVSAPSRGAWLQLTQARPALHWSAQGQGLRATLPAGKLQALGATLSWADASWRASLPGSAELLPDLNLDLRLHPLPLAPLMARLQPDFGWGGDLQVQGNLQLRTRPQLQLDAVLERSQGDLQVTEDLGIQRLGLSELRLGLIGSPGVWHFSHALAGSQIGVLAGAITARHDPTHWLPNAQATLQGVLEARVANLSTWGAWVPTGWRLGGSLFASASYAGQLHAPQVHGQAGARDLSLRNPLLGVDWRDGDMDLVFQGSRAELKQLRAKAGDGELSVQGQLQLGAQPEARLQAEARQFRLLRRVDRRLTVSGQIGMQFGQQLREVQGKLRVDEGLLDFSKGDAPTLGDDVDVIRPEAVAAHEAKHPSTPVQLRLAIDMGERLRLRGYGVDTLLRGELQLSQPKGEPVLHGVLRTESGSFEAYGQKLDIDKGQLSFIGPYDNPRIEFLAIRPNNDDVKVGVSVTGTAQSPRIKLYADPDDKTENEKLSWLLLGRAPEDLGRGDSALLQRAALALLSGDGKSRTGQVIKSLGLDELSVSDTGSDARGTVVRLGKQLSKRWYVGYERSLATATGSWQLIYRIAQRFTLRGQSGDDNALDLIWQWKWD